MERAYTKVGELTKPILDFEVMFSINTIREITTLERPLLSKWSFPELMLQEKVIQFHRGRYNRLVGMFSTYITVCVPNVTMTDENFLVWVGYSSDKVYSAITGKMYSLWSL